MPRRLLALLAPPRRPGAAGRLLPRRRRVGSDGRRVRPPRAAGRRPRAAAARPTYRATIRRTEHGIPHITGRQLRRPRLRQRLRGRRHLDLHAARHPGHRPRRAVALVRRRTARYDDQVTLEASNLQVDAFVTDLRNRRVVEKLLADPVPARASRRARWSRGYVAGANKWLRTPRQVTDPACRGAAYLDSREGHRRSTSGTASTWPTCWPRPACSSRRSSTPTRRRPTTRACPSCPLAADVDRDALLDGARPRPEPPFGSNATAVGGDETTTGRGMLLGNPHFPWRGRYHFTQQHLTIPGKYDVAGASLIGSPVVNIGWNKNVAWSHTVSTAYRFTPYEYQPRRRPTTYLTDAGPQAAGAPHGQGRGAAQGRQLEHGAARTSTAPPRATSSTPPDDADAVDARPASGRSATPTPSTCAPIDTFLEMGKATERPRPDPPPGHGRAGCRGSTPPPRTATATSCTPTTRSCRTCPTTLAEQCMTPVGRVLYQLAGLPGLDGTRADSTCEWRTDADAAAARHLRAGATCRESSARDWVMNANDSYWTPNATRPARGLRPDHRLRAVRADDAHPDGLRATSRPAGATAAPARRRPQSLRRARAREPGAWPPR